jgi:hypothetical protein
VPTGPRQLFTGDEVRRPCCCRERQVQRRGNALCCPITADLGRCQGLRTGEDAAMGDPYGSRMFWRISKARHSSAS